MNVNEIIALAKSAGKLARDGFGQDSMSRIVGRGHGGDMTRRIDQAVEEMVSEKAREVGNIEILTEESGVLRFGEPKFRWVVDPLDGSTNFSRGIPFFGISILVQHLPSKEAIVGVIYDPMRDRLYRAEPGEGAYINEQRLKTNSDRTLEERVFYLDLHFGRDKERFDDFIGRYQNLGSIFNTYRSLGSAALAMALTASGHLDGFLDLSGNSRFLDIAAGSLIVEEAGGCVTNLAGQPIGEEYDSLVACASPDLNKKMREILSA
jgi:myo-inositol-1(or 4)-monophosphatase